MSCIKKENHRLFSLCRENKWSNVLAIVRDDPIIAMSKLTMDNNIQTTVLHQAITSKGPVQARAAVCHQILGQTPRAAALRNGYGSLPLHVVAQRNTKIDSQTKEALIIALVDAYPGALLEEGGVGKRTPLHIIFTDYITPAIVEMMIARGRGACFMKDKKGYLPAHVACSRHCSPEKLRMLLAVNPNALTARTNDGQTLLQLATNTATKSHPNYALIGELKQILDENGFGLDNSFQPCVHHSTTPRRNTIGEDIGMEDLLSPVSPESSKLSPFLSVPSSSLDDSPGERRGRKRKVTSEDVSEEAGFEEPANLLLHFSRNQACELDDVKHITTV